MKRLLLVGLCLLSFASHAHGGDPAPLCVKGSPPNCVVPNWGQVGPDGTDDVMAPHAADPVASTTGAVRSRMAVQVMPVALSGRSSAAPLRSVVSPINLFPRETLMLTNALQRARFDSDGAIVRGAEAIAAAAAAAARRAGDRYALTLYIKVPERIQDEDSAALARRVQSINAVIVKANRRDPNGKPTT